MKSDKVYIIHILQSIQRILDYTQDLSFEKFSNNKMAIDAVIRNFEIIGEATKKVSSQTLSKYPDIPWKRMAGLRDKLIHDYVRINLEIVWEVIIAILPHQQKEMEKIFSELN